MQTFLQSKCMAGQQRHRSDRLANLTQLDLQVSDGDSIIAPFNSIMLPADLTLETSKVLMRPLAEDDFDAFLQLTQEKDMWKYFTLDLSDPAQLKKWMNGHFRDKAANTRHPFTIIEKSSGKVAGSMSMMNISFHDLRMEIGASWLGQQFRSTGINLHSKYSMMRYAFEEMNFERVEFKTDVLNVRARKGLQKIGGKEEGILRSHMTMWNNRRRSSIYFSVLKEEWPGVKQTIFKDIQ
jgi:RimJ/RimL family protein N-acetyltransferase